MPSEIGGRGYTFFVSTSRLFTLVDFALQIGRAAAKQDSQHSYVNAFWQWRQSAPKNAPLELDERFPSLDQKKFWAVVFRNVARRIYRRELGDHSVSHWQSRAITDAVNIARLLADEVHAEEPGWFFETEDEIEEVGAGVVGADAKGTVVEPRS